MARFILRPLFISIWLACVVIAAVMLISRSFGSTTALIFIQQERTDGQTIGYYDPHSNLLVTRVDHTDLTDWATPDDDDTVRRNTYVAPRSTQTGVDLFLVSTNNQILRQLTHIQDFPPISQQFRNLRDNGDPQWSPDDQWIAFISTASQSERDVYVIRPDGRDLREVASDLSTVKPQVRWGIVPQLNFSAAPFFLIVSALGIFWLFHRDILQYIANLGNGLGLSG